MRRSRKSSPSSNSILWRGAACGSRALQATPLQRPISRSEPILEDQRSKIEDEDEFEDDCERELGSDHYDDNDLPIAPIGAANKEGTALAYSGLGFHHLLGALEK